jgi:PST family polysaccharide transporter
VFFSGLSRLQADRRRFVLALRKANRVVSIAAIPLGMGTFVLRDFIAHVLFNETWAGIADILGWLALTQGLSWTVGLNAPAYRAIGRPDVTVKLNAALVTLYAPVYWVAAGHGIDALLQARFIMALAGVVLHVAVMQNILSYSARDYLGQVRVPLIAGVGTAFALMVVIRAWDLVPSFLGLCGLGLLGAAVFVLLIWPEWRFLRGVFANVYSGANRA